MSHCCVFLCSSLGSRILDDLTRMSANLPYLSLVIVLIAPIWFGGYVADVDAPCEASKDADTHLDVEVTISGRTSGRTIPIWTNMKCSTNQI